VRRTAPRLIAAALAATAAIAVAACGDDEGGAPDGGQREVTRGGTLTMLSASDVDSLDPGRTGYAVGYQVAYATQRPLYSFVPGNAAQAAPDLAAGPPSVSADGRTITVRLRSGVRFSPPVNREVTSDDVAYAFERAFSAPVTYPYPQYFRDLVGVPAKHTATPQRISGIETPDARTIVFRLRRPTTAPFIAALGLPVTAPVPREYAQRFDTGPQSTYGRRVVATGPYMVRNDAEGRTVGYQFGRRIELVRNPSWRRDTDRRPAYASSIVLNTNRADRQIAARQVLLGRHRVLSGAAPPSVLADLAGRRSGQALAVTGNGFRYMPLNTTIRPFDDVNVRRAVLAAFDREAAVKLRGGRGTGELATHFLPPGMPGFEEAGGRAGPGLDFLDPRNAGGNLELARMYLRRAGYPSGRYEGKETFLMVGPNGEPDRGVAEHAKAQLERLGFRIRLRLLAYDAMITDWCQVPSRKVAICGGLSWLRDFADPATMLETAFAGFTIEPRANGNMPQLRNAEIDRAMRRAETLRGAERARAWGEIDRMITEQAPAILLQWDRYTLLRSADVAGVANPAFADWDLAYTGLR
jgi:peptide/nickel transport system substrate-binding protein